MLTALVVYTYCRWALEIHSHLNLFKIGLEKSGFEISHIGLNINITTRTSYLYRILHSCLYASKRTTAIFNCNYGEFADTVAT